MKQLIFYLSFMLYLPINAQMVPDKVVEIMDEIDMVEFESKFEILDTYFAKTPNDPWLYWLRANVYELMGNEGEMFEDLEKSITVDSTFAPGYAGIARLISYEIEEEQENKDLALEAIEKAIQLDPSESYYRLERGRIYLLIGELDKAEYDANYCISTHDFGMNEGEQLMIEILSKRGNQESLNSFVKEHDMTGFAEFLGYDFCLLLASCYEQMNDFEKACICYNGAASMYEMMDDEVPAELITKLKNCK